VKDECEKNLKSKYEGNLKSERRTLKRRKLVEKERRKFFWDLKYEEKYPFSGLLLKII